MTDNLLNNFKLIGAGWGRTGTASTHEALNQLGIPCYHMFEVFKGGMTHVDFWLKVAKSPSRMQHNWEEVFHGFDACVDFPACIVYKELMEQYPHAKVLLTEHPKGPEAWYKSCMETIVPASCDWSVQIFSLISPFERKWLEMVHTLPQGRSMVSFRKPWEPWEKSRIIAAYKAHIEDVKAFVPADRLLVFSVDQGWEPLCKFLDVPIPSIPFPKINDTVEFKDRSRKKKLRLIVVLVVLFVIAIIVLRNLLL
jgi:Sulfotransferase domain